MADSFFALEQIIDYAISNRVSWVIGAGDLIDKQRNRSAPITFFHQQLDKLADANIKFGYIQGQHDFDDPPWLSGHRNAHHLHAKPVHIGDVCVTGLDYQPIGKLQEELANLRQTKPDMLIAHQVWASWMGDIALPQGDFGQIPVVRSLFTGDLHQQRQENVRGADGQRLAVYSPGCTYQKAINEPSQHFFYVMRSDGTLAMRPLRSRPCIDWSVMVTTEDLDKFVAEVRSELTNAAAKAGRLPVELTRPLLRVTYSPRLVDTVRRVSRAVEDRAILFWKELQPEERVQKQAAAKLSKGDAVTPLSELPQVVDADADPEVFQLLQSLLETTTPDQAKKRLADWRADYLKGVS